MGSELVRECGGEGGGVGGWACEGMNSKLWGVNCHRAGLYGCVLL